MQGITEFWEKHFRKNALKEAHHIEMMAAAFMKETGLKASKCELVIRHNGLSEITYHYQKRNNKKEKNNAAD